MYEERGDSIWRLEGAHPGTDLVMLGGMHGNEPTGIEAVRYFLEHPPAIARGSLTLILGNTKAIEANERWVEGRDLNRYFTDAHLVDRIEGTWEEERAEEIAAVLREADILIDLHSTNKPSVPFACSRVDAAHERLYRWFPLAHVIEDPDYVFGDEPVTSEEYMDRVGNVGVCLETGMAGEEGQLAGTIAGLEKVMGEVGLVEGTLPTPQPSPAAWRFYTTIKLDERGFRFVSGMGTHSFQPVGAGQILGYRGDEPVVLDRDGVIVFPKLPEHQQMGKPVCYIATPASVV